ncbi:MAG: SDR family NAD(P)-dependent oxidoreductase [Gemmatimonadaceae bacterium]|nr:SDR family NAD(P)-dependent oxidoreductase [Gemmatimonadaceae bacterium]
MAPRPLALVTGASSGIGRIFALKLAARGYDLLLVARDADRLAALTSELAGLGAGATSIVADLGSEAGLQAVEGGIVAADRLDLLVNNAGFGTTGTFVDAAADQQEQMLRLHVIAVSRLTRAALQRMRPVRRGGIITVSSVASFTNSSGNVNYCATKAYQRSFSEGLAIECEPDGIRVQALCPGFTSTEFHARMAFDQRGRAPDWMWLGADEVVETSLRQFEANGPVVCVPGAQYKVIVFFARHLPLWVKRLLTQRVYKRD